MIELDELIDYVNETLDLDIRENTRKREVVEARAFYYELARKLTNYSLDKIGNSLDKHHSTVLYSLKNVVMYLNKEDIDKSLAELGYKKRKSTFSELIERVAFLENQLESLKQ